MKMKLISFLACAGLVAMANSALALDSSGQRITRMLASGGPNTVSDAAQDVYNQRIVDQEVLDVTAETLNQYYTRNQNDRDYVDATSWLCKALGSSGNGRYRDFVQTVVKSHVHKRARKYCDNALDGLPKGVANQFQPGSVDLAKYKESSSAQRAGTPPPAANSRPSGRRTVDFSEVHEGMSQQEVEDMIGPPTATTGHVTGKAFAPFNYRGKDTVRMYALYKGVGKIVYSNDSRYSGTYRVREVIADPNESGYP